MTAAEIVDRFIQLDRNPAALVKDLIEGKAVECGFKYVYTGDDHYLYATREQAEAMLTDMLNIRVEIEQSASKEKQG